MMRSTTIISYLISATLLTGCGAIHRDISKANNYLYEGSQKTRAKLAGYIYDDSQEPLPPPPSPMRYCYDLRSDVVCYDQPKTGLSAQRMGTGVALISDEEMQLSQVYNQNGVPSQGGIGADPNRNIGTFFNPAAPNANQALRNNNVAERSGTSFVPAPPTIRGVNDPVSNAPSRKDTSGFVQNSSKTQTDKKTDVFTGSSDDSPTMNTQGPAPTKPPSWFEDAPTPLM
ncbi:MAG: hypothetical protein K2Q12_05720 [Rickettsiales bacterium]|nr:hypothetical protein [Rickettsiales bacterium]